MRIKDIGNINARVLRENTPQDYTFQYIDISSVSSDGQISLSEPMRYDESPSRARRIVKKDDVIVSTVRTYLRAIAGIDWDAKDTIASTGFAVISPDKKYDPSYVKYLMTSNAVVDEICKESTGVSYPAISSSRLSAIHIPTASLNEQKAISTYLNKQINSINERICLRERELQTLIKLKQSEINSVVTRGLNPAVPMKDSGIPWIGQIPAHWQVRRIKDVFHIISGNGFRVELQGNDNGDYPFCKASDLNGQGAYVDSAKNWVTREIAFSEHYNIIRPKSILFPKIGESLKKNHRKINLCPCIVDNNCAALVPYTKDSLLFFFYVLTLVDMGDFNNGGAVPSVNISDLLTYPIPYPPIQEQKEIAEYIENKLKAIESMVDNINAQIDKLKLLKKALINEVVTGQRPIAQ